MQESSENQFCRIKNPKIRLQKNISISFWMLRAAKIDRLKKSASFILQIKIKYLRYCLPLRSLNGSKGQLISKAIYGVLDSPKK